jgi:two-component sensor histidine kinase
MQAYKSTDLNFKEAMKESQSKIYVMALVHEFLYLGENLHSVNLNGYINRLIQDIKELYLSKDTTLIVDLHIEEIEFSINRCIQLGMILHELYVNSLKYAFKEDKNNLFCIHIKREKENIRMKIRDNGAGLEDLTNLEKINSIGMQLIHSIVDFQLDGTINFINNNGLECNIIFPEKESL